MEYYTLHISVMIMMWAVSFILGGFLLAPIRHNINDIKDLKYHPCNAFKIPITWYEYTYHINVNDGRMFPVSFYVNNTNNNNEIINAIYESINCARNKRIDHSMVSFIKPVYELVLINEIADDISHIDFIDYTVIKS